MTAPWRLTVVAGEQCAPKRWTTTSQRLRQKRCFGPHCLMLGNAFTNKEELFTWAKNNNRDCSTSTALTEQAILHLAMQIHTTGTAQEASGLLFSVVLLDVNEPDVAATTRMVIDARWRVALVGVENLHAQIVLYMEIVDG
ncbi:hypothetical protein OsJ_20888 [Oryza sativa Japonica Group]|uniref:Uncharacterized protein n=2 Tax=Oryza TaxID=4527 RepID=Q5Z7V4_ORYSJ|nr:hypothetical protein OsJ_20888 [Oryza sativa Japonica Group]BAD54087.1 hypothetical protein [Oryza sativa Japonica Group]BAD54349.1 hypothetical protein [Oryza sativa Japonica Group]